MRSIQNLFIPSIAICLLGFGQPAKESTRPSAILVKSADAPPYLRVLDCTRGTNCRQLDFGQAVTIVEDFMFFSIFSAGVDVEAHHNVRLKIGGVTIPNALNALVREGENTQRFNFIVDVQRYKGLPRATPSNIEVWVDGTKITLRGVDH